MKMFEARCRESHIDTLTLEKIHERRYVFRITDYPSGCRSTVILNRARMIELLMILHNELKDEQTPEDIIGNVDLDDGC